MRPSIGTITYGQPPSTAAILAAAFEMRSVCVNDPVIVIEIVVTLVLKIVLVIGMYFVTCVVLVRGVEVVTVT